MICFDSPERDFRFAVAFSHSVFLTLHFSSIPHYPVTKSPKHTLSNLPEHLLVSNRNTTQHQPNTNPPWSVPFMSSSPLLHHHHPTNCGFKSDNSTPRQINNILRGRFRNEHRPQIISNTIPLNAQ